MKSISWASHASALVLLLTAIGVLFAEDTRVTEMARPFVDLETVSRGPVAVSLVFLAIVFVSAGAFVGRMRAK